MRKVGIIGGTGPEATVDYYQSIIAEYQNRIGSKEDLPELVINSINMYKIFNLLEEDEKSELVDYLVEAIQSLERAGVDFAVLSANTAHIVFEEVEKRVSIPLISMIQAASAKAKELGLQKVGLIGTGFTMASDFYENAFSKNNQEIIVPSKEDQDYIHRKIVDELEQGIVKEETKSRFLKIIRKMVAEQKAEGIILGCTELPLMIKESDLDVPALNTTAIHVNRILDAVLGAGESIDD
ncbi:amino acid racemase [Aciduricibacillus chroicocephali]|uniref:Amino acid racemase n=1 Tax=Aciduricibacillus chroicocephali TaxID=3054939 RepID=A0ABY9KVZ4_9BACI|nr:amino acid racemase [Bacillaceae bacterium 44XB]